ncbi:hypothetical protein ACU635_33560 [[Actinomadura] parvosata]|uniref:hypothetical protein n=1 Tax=[Actinomadura] parvosata TaxID=1955412 RepID=UPI00406D27EF
MPGSFADAGSVETQRPSRMTVTRWHSAKISSKRWETSSTAVGSSVIRMRTSNASALPISTSC